MIGLKAFGSLLLVVQELYRQRKARRHPPWTSSHFPSASQQSFPFLTLFPIFFQPLAKHPPRQAWEHRLFELLAAAASSTAVERLLEQQAAQARRIEFASGALCQCVAIAHCTASVFVP